MSICALDPPFKAPQLIRLCPCHVAFLPRRAAASRLPGSVQRTLAAPAPFAAV
ncbi:hypothetical protein DPMN_170038 [Dreissena polymorpha]|uniref:Uncharacterized protein n=1 Tax=Dreissena polymorpha TaxID=45954 RepID=A0A9D4DVH0_DREPO|nr:hypothetical protein DPMN_170038 [Dreissena polymorpha]